MKTEEPFTPLSDFFVITMPEIPTPEKVAEWVETHKEPFDHDRWIIPCLVLGAFLVVTAGLALIAMGMQR